MLSSFVLRLVPHALADGDVVGEVLEVESGRNAPIRNIGELLAFLRGPAIELSEEQG